MCRNLCKNLVLRSMKQLSLLISKWPRNSLGVWRNRFLRPLLGVQFICALIIIKCETITCWILRSSWKNLVLVGMKFLSKLFVKHVIIPQSEHRLRRYYHRSTSIHDHWEDVLHQDVHWDECGPLVAVSAVT